MTDSPRSNRPAPRTPAAVEAELRRRVRTELTQARAASETGELDDAALAEIIARAAAAALSWHLEAPEHTRNSTLSSRSWRPAPGPRGGARQPQPDEERPPRADYDRRPPRGFPPRDFERGPRERDFERGPRDFDRGPRDFDRDRPSRDFDRGPREFDRDRPSRDFDQRDTRPPARGGGFKPGGFKPGGFKPGGFKSGGFKRGGAGGGGFSSRRPPRGR